MRSAFRMAVTDSEVDVAILGAGPAGSVLALRLAALGHRVALIDHDRRPAGRIGEALSAGVGSLLDFLGAREAMAAEHFPTCPGIHRRWRADTGWSIDPKPGWIVDRARFDALLRRIAQAWGARCVFGVARLHPGADLWRIECHRASPRVALRSAWLVDASGSGRALRARPVREGPRTLALHARQQVRSPPMLAAFASGWCWRVPLPDGGCRSFAFLDPARAASGGDAGARLTEALTASGLGAEGLLPESLGGADATPSRVPAAVDLVGRRLWVGEAALRIDPLAACGVQLAMQNALVAALCLNTLLRRPQAAALAAAYYEQHLAEAAARHRRAAVALYAEARDSGRQDAFWRARAEAVVPALPAPPSARAVGDFIVG